MQAEQVEDTVAVQRPAGQIRRASMSHPADHPSVADALAGRYEVDREIGRGGMATVYLARDTKHNRKVALKVLNQELGAVLGVQRFLSEIQVTANLQHPNLLPLYDSGESNGLLYYVMPYVEGEGLRNRLEREKQLSADDAIRIAIAVAGALDHAHKHGVIHRDLKPENILLQGGEPFVADFGIALAVSTAGGNRLTQTGLSVGTPQYMAPEQAMGDRTIDARTDVYALGCVLYEMLAGEPPHIGGTAQAVIARMMTEKPRPVRELRDTLPERFDWIVAKALAKVPADRFATAGEMRDALLDLTKVGAWKTSPAPRARKVSAATIVPWALLAGVVAYASLIPNRPSNVQPVQLEVVIPRASFESNLWTTDLAVSPDGRSLAFVGGDSTSKQLYVRLLDDLEPRPIAGTTGATIPVWSPDGKTIAFTAGNQVRRIPVSGGTPELVSPFGFGYDWNDDGTMIIGSSIAGTGLRITTGNGGLRPLTRPAIDSGEMYHAYPLRLPKNKVAFVIWGPGGLEDDYLAIGDLRTGEYVESKLLAAVTIAYQDGWLLYQDIDRRLMAARVDLGAMTFDRTPVVIEQNVVFASMTPKAAFMLRGERTTAIQRLSTNGTRQPETLLESDGIITGTQLSPDGKRIAYVVTRGDSAQLFVHDLRTRSSARLWTGGGVKDPVWTPDGQQLVFSEGAPRLGLWRILASGAEAPHLITAEGYPRHPIVLPDNHTVVYAANVSAGPSSRRYDLWEASIVGNANPRSLVSTQDGTSLPDISPNGKWLAYDANDVTRDEVYVRPVRGAGQVRVSLEGGMEPRWSHDGRKLYYRAGGDVFAATIAESGGAIEVLKRERVAHFASASASEWDPMFDLAENGDLLISSANEKNWQLIFVQNWKDELQRRLKR